MDQELTPEAARIKDSVLLGFEDGTLHEADVDWADDRRTDGVSAVEILLELLDRSKERRKDKRA